MTELGAGQNAGDGRWHLVTDLPDGGPGYTGRTDLLNRLYREGRMCTACERGECGRDHTRLLRRGTEVWR